MHRPSEQRLLLAIVLVGTALRLWQWGADGTLWLDEIALSRNVFELSVPELLTGRLAFDQVAPPGFLAVVKVATIAFGENERGLWLFPLIAGLAGLWLFSRLAHRLLRGTAILLSVAMYAIALAPIRYSGEVKQYGFDATALIFLTLLAFDLRQRDRSVGRLALVGAAGFAVIPFSQASAIVMAGLGAALAIAWLIERDQRTLRALLVTVPIWAAASIAAVVIGERSMSPSTRAFMKEFWAGGFLPLPARPLFIVFWIWRRVTGLFGDPWTLSYPLPWIFAVLTLSGFVVLWRQRRDAALLIAGPLVMTLLAAIAQQYPFRTRLVVFLIPTAILAAAAGAGWIADVCGRHLGNIAALIVAAAVLIPPVKVIAEAGVPLHVDNYKPIYAHLQAKRRPGDVMLVSFLANSSAIFYGPRYGVRRGEYELGACEPKDTRAYIRDVDRFRGQQRVWVLWKNNVAYRVPREATHQYLDTIGVARDSLFVPSPIGDGVSLTLYDLSDPARLRAANAETFPVPPMPAYPKPGCRDWGGEVRASR